MAGVKKPGIVVHSLQHSAGTYATLNGVPPSQVQRMMRHKHYGTTEIYVEEVQKLLEVAEEAVTQILKVVDRIVSSNHRHRGSRHVI